MQSPHWHMQITFSVEIYILWHITYHLICKLSGNLNTGRRDFAPGREENYAPLHSNRPVQALSITCTDATIIPWVTASIKLLLPSRRRSGVFIVNFEHISHLVLVFLLLTLNRQMPAGMPVSTTIPTWCSKRELVCSCLILNFIIFCLNGK